MLTEKGVNPFTEPKLVSPAEAERRLGSKKLVKVLAYVPSIGTALVPESTKRPAIEPGAVFDTLTDKESTNG